MAPNSLIFLHTIVPFFLCSQFYPTLSRQTNINQHVQDQSHHANTTTVLDLDHVNRLFPVSHVLVKDVYGEKVVLKSKLSSNSKLFKKLYRPQSRSLSNKASKPRKPLPYQFPVGVRLAFLYFLKLFLWGAKKKLQKREVKANGVIETSYSDIKLKEE